MSGCLHVGVCRVDFGWRKHLAFWPMICPGPRDHGAHENFRSSKEDIASIAKPIVHNSLMRYIAANAVIWIHSEARGSGDGGSQLAAGQIRSTLFCRFVTLALWSVWKHLVS